MSWNIYFNNTTEKPVSFSFYQENSILDQNSYAYVWHNGISEKGEKVGPIVIPSEVFVSVQTEGEQATTRQQVKRGETWSYSSDGNKLVFVSTDDEAYDISVENAASNKTPINATIWKNNNAIFQQKGIAPGDSLEVSISPKVFVFESSKLNVGDEFQVLTLEQERVAYDLEEGEVTIIAKSENGKITFA